MTAPRCPVCFDTGETGVEGILDCTACSAPSDRAALNAFVKSLGPMSQDDLLWLVHQRAVSQIKEALRKITRYESVGNESGGGIEEYANGDYVLMADVMTAIAQEKTK